MLVPSSLILATSVALPALFRVCGVSGNRHRWRTARGQQYDERNTHSATGHEIASTHLQVTDKTRCPWAAGADPDYIRYHDEEWGRPVHDDRLLFEMLT